MYWQGGLCLTGKAKSASILKGAALETGDFESILKDIYHHLQMIVSFCLADYSAAEEMAERFWSENELEVGTVVGIPLHQMIRGLIAMRQALTTGDKRYKKRLRNRIKYLKVWKKQGATTTAAMLTLLEASLVRLEKPKDERLVLGAYGTAIDTATADRYDHVSAIANEQAALYLIERNGGRATTAAGYYLKDSLMHYLEWGALAKVEMMVKDYSFLAECIAEDASTEDGFSTMVQTGNTTAPCFGSFWVFK
jgi:hypothetical protein